MVKIPQKKKVKHGKGVGSREESSYFMDVPYKLTCQKEERK